VQSRDGGKEKESEKESLRGGALKEEFGANLAKRDILHVQGKPKRRKVSEGVQELIPLSGDEKQLGNSIAP